MYGAYLLAVYNEEEEQFQTISKIGTGFSEVLLAQLSESLKPAIIPAPKSYYRCWGKRKGLNVKADLHPVPRCSVHALHIIVDGSGCDLGKVSSDLLLVSGAHCRH